MKRVCLLFALISSSMTGIAQNPIVRARLQPIRDIVVGQPVQLFVSVLVPNYFTGSPGFPEFEIENAIVVMPQERPQNTNEQIGGTTYAGITETYTIYPQQAGDFSIPSAVVVTSYASAPPATAVAYLKIPNLEFHASVPEVAADLGYFLPTTHLTIQQKWSAPLRSLRAGDTVERTIVITATKTQAMLIPPLSFVSPGGIRVYEEEPNVRDQKTDRGDFAYGRRMQSAKYFLQKEGDYTLPAIELKWWNLSAKRLITAALPSVHFTVAANANYVTDLPPEAEPVINAPPSHMHLWIRYKSWIYAIIACSGALFFLLLVGWRYLPRGYRGVQRWRGRREHSEPTYFRKLERACNRNDAAQCYLWLLNWLAVALPGTALEEFLSDAGDAALSSATNDLGTCLFAKTTGIAFWDGKKMARLLRQRRKRQKRIAASSALAPKLNP